MNKWVERLVGAWFGAVGATLAIGALQLFSLERSGVGYKVSEYLASVALEACIIGLVGLPLLVAAVAMGKRERPVPRGQ